MWPGLLAAEVRPAGDHLLVDVLVADLGPDEADAALLEGPFEAHVAHARRHDLVRPQAARLLHVQGLDEERVVAAEKASVPVHPERAVGVPIIGDADGRARLVAPARPVTLEMQRAAAGVDVSAVWRGVDRLDLEAERR